MKKKIETDTNDTSKDDKIRKAVDELNKKSSLNLEEFEIESGYYP